jgi:hypothetical protein
VVGQEVHPRKIDMGAESEKMSTSRRAKRWEESK